MTQYQVLIHDTGTGFGVGDHMFTFENAKNLGWARYLNDIGEAYFTVNQDDIHLSAALADTLRTREGIAHVTYLRDGNVAWRGFLGEHEASERDVIFYAYGYEAHLHWLCSTWNMTWKDEEVGDIIADLWTRAKTGIPDSPLEWVTTGTIEDPVTASGGATKIELPSYKLYYKRILHAFKELVAVATSDTTNTAFFEIDYPTTFTDHSATFNMWKDRSTARSIVLEYGHNVLGFGDNFAPILARNHVLGVGSGAHNLLLRYNNPDTSGERGTTLFGRRHEPVYLNWVRDQTELERVIKLRQAKARRFDMDLSLRMRRGSLPPLSGYALGDRFRVRIDRGITQVDKDMMMVGIQVRANRGSETVTPLMLDRAGS